MNYRSLFERSCSIVWKNPIIWFFVLLASSGTLISYLPQWFENLYCLLPLVGAVAGLISVPGIMWLVYDVEKGNKPSIRRTWDSIKESLVGYIVAGFPLIFIALLITIPIACVSFVGFLFFPSSPEKTKFWFSSICFIASGIGMIVTPFPSAKIIISKVEDVVIAVQEGLKLVQRKLNQVIAINLMIIALYFMAMVIAGILAVIIGNVTWDELRQATFFQAYFMITATPTYMISATILDYIIFPFGIASLTLAYLEFVGQASDEVLESSPTTG